ncbi:unnamed protein product [Dicrocoelium dendriticum]|nr:unnamed protein product [Dicrocoelium dendriticum]
MKNHFQSALYQSTQKQLMGRPPRPRQSVSPAMNNKNNQIRVEVHEKDVQPECGENFAEKDDFPSEYYPVRSEVTYSDEKECTPSMRTDYSPTETLTNVSASDHKSWMDKWIQDAIPFDPVCSQPPYNPTGTRMPVSTQSFGFQKNPPPTLFTQVCTPISSSGASDDILAQWRLRRKMETARFTGLTFGHCLSHHPWLVPQPCAPFWAYQTRPGGTPQSVFEQTHVSRDVSCRAEPHTFGGHTVESFKANKATQCASVPKRTALTASTQTNDPDLHGHLPTSTLRDSSVMTDDPAAFSTDSRLPTLKLEQRSVRTMASPCLRDVEVQTPVVCGRQQQPPSPVSPVGQAKPAFQRRSLFPPLPDHSGSDHYTDADTWSWPPSPSPSHLADGVGSLHTTVSRRDATVQTADPEIVECFLQTNNANESTNIGAPCADHSSDREVCNEPKASTPGPHATRMGSRIAQYLQQAAVTDPVNPQWLHDEVVQNLLRQRSECLHQLKCVIGAISEREMTIVENVLRQQPLAGPSV